MQRRADVDDAGARRLAQLGERAAAHLERPDGVNLHHCRIRRQHRQHVSGTGKVHYAGICTTCKQCALWM